jgi:hypothetical protein
MKGMFEITFSYYAITIAIDYGGEGYASPCLSLLTPIYTAAIGDRANASGRAKAL